MFYIFWFGNMFCILNDIYFFDILIAEMVRIPNILYILILETIFRGIITFIFLTF